MQGGWIKVFREFSQWEWFHKPEMVQIFIYLLLKANSEDGVFEGEIIPRGSLVTSVKNLSWGTHLTPQVVRTCLERLKSTNEITSKSTNKYTIITLCNYDKYQCSQNEVNKQNNEQTNNQLTNNQQTNNKQITNNQQQYKNIRNKEDNIFSLSNVRTREEELTEDLRVNASWQENILMKFYSYKLSKDNLLAYINEFELEQKCKNITHANDTHIKSHFTDWLRNLLDNKNQTKNGKSTKQTIGFDVTATTAKDYKGIF